MTEPVKPRAVGLNHIALEVGDIEEALKFYGRLFRFELRGKSETIAFIDLGDQFIALQKGRRQPADDGRHFGLVVDDKEAARSTLKDAGVTTLNGGFLDFRDPTRSKSSVLSCLPTVPALPMVTNESFGTFSFYSSSPASYGPAVFL